ncbi:MAG: DUF2635 domain-containing protein [Acetobacteraceae bacterium]|nr:DUF2635 domain-containing protein [Acetobacteraceae bacterium]
MRAADDARYSPRGWTGRELFVIPAPGRTVRMPRVPREFLPAGGGLVPDDAFWRRRLVAGDVLLGRPGEENPTTR